MTLEIWLKRRIRLVQTFLTSAIAFMAFSRTFNTCSVVIFSRSRDASSSRFSHSRLWGKQDCLSVQTRAWSEQLFSWICCAGRNIPKQYEDFENIRVQRGYVKASDHVCAYLLMSLRFWSALINSACVSARRASASSNLS